MFFIEILLHKYSKALYQENVSTSRGGGSLATTTNCNATMAYSEWYGMYTAFAHKRPKAMTFFLAFDRKRGRTFHQVAKTR